MNKFDQAISAFDSYNQRSPVNITWEGRVYPIEYFYALRLSDWIEKLESNAPESLLLAARCQHIGRWEIARSSYPMDRGGYLRWRSDLAKYHAEISTKILSETGYDQPMIDAVREIVLKRKIKQNTAVQTMENALCLVFLEFQYDDLIAKYSDDKIIDILRKTWGKMSEPGQTAALSLSYSEKGKKLIEQALAG